MRAAQASCSAAWSEASPTTARPAACSSAGLPKSHTAAGVGYGKLSADGLGGVKVDANGMDCLVLAVDTAAKTAVIKL